MPASEDANRTSGILISLLSDMSEMRAALLEAPFRLPVALRRSDLVAKHFRGLGDQTRVRILELLRDEGELTVGHWSSGSSCRSRRSRIIWLVCVGVASSRRGVSTAPSTTGSPTSAC